MWPICPVCLQSITESESPEYFARLFRKHDLVGGHVIKLGPGNDDAAKAALAAWPSEFILSHKSPVAMFSII